MKPFDTIAIVGVGVIGGSLGLAIKRKLPETHIIGISRQSTLNEALQIGAIDEGYTRDQMQKALSEADLVFLCAPIEIIIRLLPDVSKWVKPGALVTDVGSTKRLIVETASQYFTEDAYYLGGHPMAGNEGKGVAWADALLFENAVYVLTPTKLTPEPLVQSFSNVAELIGAKVLVLEPEIHDKIAAAISHLPQLVAVTLMNLISLHQKENPFYLQLAAGGFRDMTRIASSPYAIWEDIISTNSEEILKLIDEFISAMQETRAQLLNQQLSEAFESSAINRLSIPRDTKGFLRSHYDLSVEVEDKPGVFASIANALADEKINIKDIEVLKIREGDSGTFRLSFESDDDRSQAQAILEKIGFNSRARK